MNKGDSVRNGSDHDVGTTPEVAQLIAETHRRALLAVVLASLFALGLAALGVILADSGLVLALVVAFLFVIAPIATFDKRVMQARTRNTTFPKLGPFREIGPDTPLPPAWVPVFPYLDIAVKLALLVLNWKCGLLVYAAGFILASCGLLDSVGSVLVGPFLRRPVATDRD